MPISFSPMRQFMKEHHISYYYLANQGIESPTLHRIRHDNPITTETLGKLCKIMKCQPGQLIEYIEDDEQP
jgi:putative transcriptional regulator